MDKAEKFKQVYPALDRDMGAEVLRHVATQRGKGDILLQGSYDFARDSLFCEWAYVVDLDTETFEVFQGFNTKPLGRKERFCQPPAESAAEDVAAALTPPKNKREYHPVRLVKKWPLSRLPSIKAFEVVLPGWDDEDDLDPTAETA